MKKGVELTFQIEFDTEDQWGLHFENKKGVHLAMIEKGEQLVFTSKDNAEYNIVVSRLRSEGSIVVVWEVKGK